MYIYIYLNVYTHKYTHTSARKLFLQYECRTRPSHTLCLSVCVCLSLCLCLCVSLPTVSLSHTYAPARKWVSSTHVVQHSSLTHTVCVSLIHSVFSLHLYTCKKMVSPVRTSCMHSSSDSYMLGTTCLWGPLGRGSSLKWSSAPPRSTTPATAPTHHAVDCDGVPHTRSGMALRTIAAPGAGTDV